ncbi:MAG: hypothetical protein PHD96_02755 [Candidatus Pacebacteria bacterium]|nr:hypothetical protein [Candidatus Paceibacterota bacterium]
MFFQKKFIGQSLLEILVALSLGVLFMGSALALFGVSFRAQTNLDFNFNSHTLLKEYAEMISYSSKNQWNSLFNLTRDTPYRIDFSNNIWSFNQGFEEGSFKGVNYRRSFKIFDVYRDASGNISLAGNLDPSTLKAVIYFDSGPNHEKTLNLTLFLTRFYLPATFTQTDWSGGSGVSGPVSDPGNTYDGGNNILAAEGSLSLATTTSSGFLISSILDTGVSDGSNFYTLIWQGELCDNCQARIQLASSNSPSGPWVYYGPTSTDDYYQPSANSLTILSYTGASSHQNKRYIRYKIELVSYEDQSPRVDSISINYAK